MVQHIGRVQGKVALVTGAASGLGAASARALAREGATVILTDLSEDAGHRVVDQIKAAGGEALFLAQDTSSEADWARVVAAAVSAFGRIDVLVNNAGISGGPFDLMSSSLEDWRKVQAVNLDGVFLGMRHVGPIMAEHGGGSVINLSSILGKVGMAGAAAYCASKGGVCLLTKAAALEWAPLNIRVNSIHPGFIETPMVANALVQSENGNEMREFLISRHALGRLGAPPEIAEAVVFLASNESSFMTGAEMVVDGGYTAA
jgi:NAD(P)-dependent dehydrogenase (short-subunit alcohol dehydrogenase family)